MQKCLLAKVISMTNISEITKNKASVNRTPRDPNCSLLVFADDWGRHPSSCQHLIVRLLPRYHVTWVNTIGMRPPRLDRVTFKRAWGKLAPWANIKSSRQDYPKNLQVVDPKMWPWFSRGHDRWLNKKMLLRGLRPVVSSLAKPVIGITTLPIVADLIGKLEVDRWVYYCVDDFSKWPGLDHQALEEMETQLINKSDRLIAASSHLKLRLERIGGRNAELMTHGVDLTHWQVVEKDQGSVKTPWDVLQGPLIVFWGLIDRRMDTEFLRTLSGSLEQGTILLVGPLEHPDPAILALPHIQHVPALDYDQLPLLASAADVLIMPYADLPVTQAMQPLKLKEYLCTGKPVVVRRLPAVEPWLDCLDAAENPQDFVAVVLQRLKVGIPAGQVRARERIIKEGWDEKAELFEDWALTH